MRNQILVIFIFFLGLYSCEKPSHNINPPPLIQHGKGVFVINEGNYGGGNGSVSYYRTDSDKVYNDIYFTVNQRPLGDVCQSMYVLGGKGYVIVNNSGKIEVVNVEDFKNTATISGFTSPRCLLQTEQGSAYVTDMYSNVIYIVNLSTATISGSIRCPGSTEEMMLVNNQVYITNTEKEYLYIADPANNKITDSIHLSYGTFSIQKDKEGKLWVMCMGNYQDQTPANLYKVNPANKEVEKSYPFSSWLNAWNKIKMNPGKDTIYFSNVSIYRMSIYDHVLPSGAFIESGNRNLYGLGIDPRTSNIYVSDAIDYVQKGKVYIYSPQGFLLKSFNAGIIPGEFCFY